MAAAGRGLGYAVDRGLPAAHHPGTDLLEQAGLVDDSGKAKPPATMDELLDYAKKLNDPPHDIFGYVMPASQPRIVYDWSGFLGPMAATTSRCPLQAGI